MQKRVLSLANLYYSLHVCFSVSVFRELINNRFNESEFLLHYFCDRVLKISLINK